MFGCLVRAGSPVPTAASDCLGRSPCIKLASSVREAAWHGGDARALAEWHVSSLARFCLRWATVVLASAPLSHGALETLAIETFYIADIALAECLALAGAGRDAGKVAVLGPPDHYYY